MSSALMGYLNRRLREEKSFNKDNYRAAGPIITISREVGCNGLVVANLLAQKLNEQKMIRKWQVLSKEIFYQSAMELSMDPEQIKRIFKQSDKYAFEEILKAFSNKTYKNEQRIINTVIGVVRNHAIDGFAIIVGRAGHIIANDIKNALHVRLIAPVEYRIKNIQENNHLNKNEALHFIKKVEKERISFRKTIKEENLHEELFDLTINRASFSNTAIIELIEQAMEKKNILQDVKPKLQYY